MTFHIHHAGATDVGIQRSHNEDAILVDGERGVFVICDGMGGHASGAVASELAVATIARALTTASPGGDEPLVHAILAANQAVYDRSALDAECHGMGTTVVGIRFDGDNVHICHVGDSRIYLLRGGELFQVTRDHSSTCTPTTPTSSASWGRRTRTSSSAPSGSASSSRSTTTSSPWKMVTCSSCAPMGSSTWPRTGWSARC